jgi:hypothetical protein
LERRLRRSAGSDSRSEHDRLALPHRSGSDQVSGFSGPVRPAGVSGPVGPIRPPAGFASGAAGLGPGRRRSNRADPWRSRPAARPGVATAAAGRDRQNHRRTPPGPAAADSGSLGPDGPPSWLAGPGPIAAAAPPDPARHRPHLLTGTPGVPLPGVEGRVRMEVVVDGRTVGPWG